MRCCINKKFWYEPGLFDWRSFRNLRAMLKWYPFVYMALLGMAYSSHLLEDHSGEQLPIARLPAASGENVAHKRVSADVTELDKNRDVFLYQAVNAYNDELNVRTGFDKFKRDFQTKNRDVGDNGSYNDLLGLQVSPSNSFVADNVAVAGNEITSISNKPGSKDTSRVPFRATYMDEFYEDQSLRDHDGLGKRGGGSSASMSCDCKVKNDLLDLGQQHFPRYLLNAVCQREMANDHPPKCRRGSHCKALEYKVKVLTFRNIFDRSGNDPALAWLPDDLRQLWRFKTVTIAAGCFCSY